MTDTFGQVGWRKNITMDGQGSFRGKKFYVNKASSDIGRRTVVHEFPGSDQASVDDLGKSVPRYKLEAFVLGDEYMVARDALAKEFQTPGAGILIHPFWGKKTVTIDGRVVIDETFTEGGAARFTLSVVEAGTLKQPTSVIDAAGSVVSKSASLLASVKAAFTAAFSAVGFIGNVVQGAIDTLNEVTATLNSIKGDITAVMNTIDTIGDAIDSFAASVSAIILLPQDLANTFTNLVGDVMAAAGEIGSAWNSYFAVGETPGDTAGSPSLAPTGASPASGDTRAAFLLASMTKLLSSLDALPAVVGTTPSRLQETANLAAVKLLTAVATVAGVCQVASVLAYTSAGAAMAMRDALVEHIDSLAEDATDDATYAAIVDLRSAVVTYLTQIATDLPAVIEHTPKITVPAIVLAQRLYGSPDLAQDIIDRNNARDPLRLSGGIPLEVLSK